MITQVLVWSRLVCQPTVQLSTVSLHMISATASDYTLQKFPLDDEETSINSNFTKIIKLDVQ